MNNSAVFKERDKGRGKGSRDRGGGIARDRGGGIVLTW